MRKEFGWEGPSEAALFFPVRLGSVLLLKKKKKRLFLNDHVSVDLGPQRECYTDYLSMSHA